MISLKNIIIFIMVILNMLIGGNAIGQLDERFGAGGVEGTTHLGQKGLKWFRDWQDSYQSDHYPPSGKNKFWTVGKIDYRTDGLGMDWRWYVLEILENTDIDLLQDFLNLCIASVDNYIVPVFDEYWYDNNDLLETALEDTLDTFKKSDKFLGIAYKGECNNTKVELPDSLPDFSITLAEDSLKINFATELNVIWTTNLKISAKLFGKWTKIGKGDCDFETKIKIAGEIVLQGEGHGRYLQITTITPTSKTKSHIDWTLLGIDFTWDALENDVEDLVDNKIEKELRQELNNDDIKKPYYLVDFFSEYLFAGAEVPTQQQILDRIYDAEQSYIEKLIVTEGRTGEYWAIGNEPNWFPVIKPDQYASFYTKYYRKIKELDPDAKILGPSIFLIKAIEDPVDIAILVIPSIFFEFFKDVKHEFENFLNTYFQKADSKMWYKEFVAHLPNDVKVDIGDFHIYPMQARTTEIDWDKVKSLMNETANYIHDISGVDTVWISEFGNIDYRRSEKEVSQMCNKFCQYLKSNRVGINKWFWYISRGNDPWFDLPGTPTPPITALLTKDLTLTEIGWTYLCHADCTPPLMAAAPTDEGDFTDSTQVVFKWTEAKEYDTGIIDYQIQVGTTPGDSNIFNAWIGNELTYAITGYHGQTLYARVRAKNGAGLIGNWSASSDGITIDATPPSVMDPPTDEGEYTISTRVTFNWTPANDNESGIIDYQFQVGTTPGDSNMFNAWIGNVLTKAVTGSIGQTLYARIRAKNGAGLIGNWSGSSDGITIGFSPIIVEAETMQNRKPWLGSPCEDGWRLTHANHSIYEDVAFPLETISHFTVTAKSEIGGNAPAWMKVQLGETFEGCCEIYSTEWEDYSFATVVPADTNRLSITFLNDSWDKNTGDDRNLLIDKIVITTKTDQAPDTSFTFEAENMRRQHPKNYQHDNYMVLVRPYAYVAHDMYFCKQQELTFVIHAKGDSVAGGLPQMDLRIDGKTTITFPISEQSNKQYQVKLTNIEPGEHRIKIAYHSDSWAYQRYLYIDKLVINAAAGGLLKPVEEPLAEEEAAAIPETFALGQNYPNPFNPETNIDYQLTHDSHVIINIYNLMGHEIRTLVNENKTAGYYTITWNGLDNNSHRVVSGVYLYSIRAGDFVCTKKMALLK